MNENNEIIDIKEKDKISCNACSGAYGFNSINHLKNTIQKFLIIHQKILIMKAKN